MPKPLLLFPFGGTAREALAVILSSAELSRQWNVLGFVDDRKEAKEKECCGVKVLGSRDVITEFSDAYVLAVPAHPRSHLKRPEIIDSLGLEPRRFAQIIHPSSVIAQDAKVGYNTFIAPHCFISTKTVIGNHCVILSNTVVSHDSQIQDYCCLGANVTISGTVSIGLGAYIGSAASIKENILIGEKSLVGIGANVIHPVEAKTVVIGNPARFLKENI